MTAKKNVGIWEQSIKSDQELKLEYKLISSHEKEIKENEIKRISIKNVIKSKINYIINLFQRIIKTSLHNNNNNYTRGLWKVISLASISF